MTRCLFVLCTLCLLSGCQEEAVHPEEFAAAFEHIDISEDLFHRMKAGLFVPAKEPLTLVVVGGHAKGMPAPTPHQYVRFSWDMGSFWVKSDKVGRVNVYMNQDVAFGHISVGASQYRGLLVTRDFIDRPIHPIGPRAFLPQDEEEAATHDHDHEGGML